MADTANYIAETNKHLHPEKNIGWRDVLSLCAHYWGQQKRLLGVILMVIVVQILIDLTIPITSGFLVDRVISALNGEASYDPAYTALFLLSGATIAC